MDNNIVKSEDASDDFKSKELDEKECEIIKTVIAARVELKLTQRKLADISGIKQPAIARLESFGATPRLDTLLTLMDALGLEMKIVKKSS